MYPGTRPGHGGGGRGGRRGGRRGRWSGRHRAAREADALELSAMPADPLPVYEVTPGLAGLLGVEGTASEGVWLPAPLAESLGVRSGERLDTGAGPMTVAGTYDYPDDGRDRRLGH